MSIALRQRGLGLFGQRLGWLNVVATGPWARAGRATRHARPHSCRAEARYAGRIPGFFDRHCGGGRWQRLLDHRRAVGPASSQFTDGKIKASFIVGLSLRLDEQQMGNYRLNVR